MDGSLIKTQKKCSNTAYNACPLRNFCQSKDKAFYLEGSQCDFFNRKMKEPLWVEADDGHFICSRCGFRHEKAGWTTSCCPSCGVEVEGALLSDFKVDLED